MLIATRHVFFDESRPAISGRLMIEVIINKSGAKTYAIRLDGECLNTATFEFEEEPSPSNRTDEFIKYHRFADFKSARSALYLCARFNTPPP